MDVKNFITDELVWLQCHGIIFLTWNAYLITDVFLGGCCCERMIWTKAPLNYLGDPHEITDNKVL